MSAASTKTLFGAIGKEVDLNLEPDAPMVDVVRAIITLLRVENAVWTEGNSHKKWQVSEAIAVAMTDGHMMRSLSFTDNFFGGGEPTLRYHCSNSQ